MHRKRTSATARKSPQDWGIEGGHTYCRQKSRTAPRSARIRRISSIAV